MILITPSNRSLYESELDQIFRLRHDMLVEQLKWTGLTSHNGRERDAFDTDDALYLCMQDDGGSVIGCMRINPATGPTLTSTHFHNLVQFADLPSGVGIYDVSRHVVARHEHSSLRESLCSFDLLCSLFELGVAEGWQTFTAVMTSRLLSALLQIGVEVNAMGFPVSMENTDCLVVSAPVDVGALQQLYRATRNSVPRLRSVAVLAPTGPAQRSALVH